MTAQGALVRVALGLGMAGLILICSQALRSTPARAHETEAMNGSSMTTLAPMPSGHVSVSGTGVERDIHFNAVGFTPGGAHQVDLVQGGCSSKMRMRGGIAIGMITADGVGAVDATVGTLTKVMRAHQSILIELGTASMGQDASTVIACASVPAHGETTIVESVTRTGRALSGSARLSYNAADKALTVHVHATGFTPGSYHAAHIHQGSCRAQGAVLYMLHDLRADGQGVIDATRTVTGVASPPPASGWYLNIHMGNSNNILSGGQPTLEFQPRLCANIDGAGMGGTPTMGSSHGQATTSDGEHTSSPLASPTRRS